MKILGKRPIISTAHYKQEKLEEIVKKARFSDRKVNAVLHSGRL